jgi:hypothetical protein
MGSSLQGEAIKEASNGFGINRFYDYQLDDHILNEPKDYLPSYYVAMPAHFSSLDIDPSQLPENLVKIIERYFELVANQSMVVIGSSQLDATSLFSSIVPRRFKVAQGSNG